MLQSQMEAIKQREEDSSEPQCVRTSSGAPLNILADHLERLAVVYVRQSTLQQVLDHQESTRLQYGLVNRAQVLGWSQERVLVIDDDLGKSGASAEGREGFGAIGGRSWT